MLKLRRRTLSIFSSSRLRITAFVAASIIVCIHIWMLNHYAVNFPLADDFIQFLAVPGYLERTNGILAKLAFLISGTPEHRIATLRVIAWAQSNLFGGFNFRYLLFLSNALCIVVGGLVWSMVRSDLKAYLAPLFAALLLSPVNFDAQYWLSGSVHYEALAAAFFALFFLSRGSKVFDVLALGLGGCSALTLSAGIFTFPAGALQLYLAKRPRMAILWLVLGAAIGAIYFVGYVRPENQSPMMDALYHPSRLIYWYFALLGSIADVSMINAGLGAIMLIVWIAIATKAMKSDVPPLFVGWAVFLFLAMGAIAVGRATFGLEAILNTRYRPYSALLLLTTLTACIPISQPNRNRWLHAGGLGSLLLLTICWYVSTIREYVPAVEELSLSQRNAVDHYTATHGHGDYGQYPPQDFGDFLLRRARDEGHFVLPFHDARRLYGVSSLPFETRRLSFTAAKPFVLAGVLSVRGQTWGPAMGAAVWLKSPTAMYMSRLSAETIFEMRWGAPRLGFWGTYSLDGVAPGIYRVGYSFARAHNEDIFWTDDWIDGK